MAGSAQLRSGAGPRLLALLAAVLVVHLFALDWLARHLEQPAVLQPLATPMFTRLLLPQAPAAAPVPQPAKPVRARPRRPAITSLAKQSPASAAPVAPEPVTAASEPARQEASRAIDQPEQAASQESPVAMAPAAEAAIAPEAGASQAAPAAPAAPALSAAESAPLDSWPADTRLNYRLGGQFRSGELHGRARVQWQRQGSRYETRVDIDITLLASMMLTSQGEVAVHGLLPRAYEERRRSGPRGLRLGDDTITLANGRAVPRPEGVQDTASQFVELSHRFATGQAVLEVGRTVSFWMARPGAVDLWTYDVVGREVLQTPRLGAVEAFHLKPRPIANPRGNITAEMWFAPSLQYLPVRIRVNMGEATYVDLMVDQIEQR
jgi:hypothetical protein